MYTSSTRLSKRSLWFAVSASVLTLSLLTGCGGATDPVNTEVVQRAEISYPKTAVAKESAWVLQQLNGESEMTAADWEPRLSKTITSEMSAVKLVSSLNTEIRPQAPFTLVKFTQEGKTGTSTLQLADLSTLELLVTIEEGGKISGIFFN